MAEALQQLVGSIDAQGANGALDLLEADNVEAATVKLSAAVQAIDQAQAAGGPALDATIDLLGLTGQALAQAGFAEAEAAVAAPSAGEQRQLDHIAELIASGKADLQAGDHVAALEDFHEAVRKAEALIN